LDTVRVLKRRFRRELYPSYTLIVSKQNTLANKTYEALSFSNKAFHGDCFSETEKFLNLFL
jgi:hypothetical protein